MRLVGSLVIVAALVATASADKKVKDMTPGFVKEAAACQIQKNGLVKVVTGGKERAASMTATELAAAKAELEHDVAVVEAELAVVDAHCTAVSGLVDFLKANADAAYKTVEKEIDARDNAVRKARKESKKIIAENQPVVRKLIAKLAERPESGRTTPPTTTEPKAKPAKFPSKRSIELPALNGSWKVSGTSITDTVEYTEKDITASVTTRVFTSATCEQQKTSLAKRTPDLGDVDAGANAASLGVAWSVRAVRKDKVPHLVSVMCMPTKTGGVLATSDIRPADKTALADQLTAVMVAMLAAHVTPASP